VRLPEFPPLSDAVLDAIAQRHGLGGVRLRRLQERGIFNVVLQLGPRHVLRVPRDHPRHVAALEREAVIVPAARAAGVRTPRLVAFDTACDLLPVPYMIYERVPGGDLARLDLEPAAAASVWRELGIDLARLHCGVLAIKLPEHEAVGDPRVLCQRRAKEGVFSSAEARWLMAWLDRLAPMVIGSTYRRCLHGDSQATNVMVRRISGKPTYSAVVDWGSSGWGDPAYDFAGVPLRAVPFMLEGYRSVSPLEGDETGEARILWRHLQLALYLLGRAPMPGWSWAEQPLPMLLEVMRFFVDAPAGAWSALAPPRSS
jgi:aminoglycoside phosphotransferase (APT) family kinase protein